MKQMKKIASLLLALIMAFSMATTAFAANKAATADGSITITNATKDQTYKIYKVFDVTYSGDAVSYSYTAKGEVDALLTALKDINSPFMLTASATDPNKYNVSLKEGKTATEVSSFLANHKNDLTVTDTQTAQGTEVKFTGLAYGYYFVESSLGTVVTIESVKPNATVIDKNQKPGWDPKDPSNPDGSGENGKFVANAAEGPFGKDNTVEIDKIAYFKINAFAPKYAGDKLVAEYIFEDTLSDGFTYNDDLKITQGNTLLNKGTDYTVNVVGKTITITVNVNKISNYPADAHLSITYSAKVNENAVYDNVNNVKMKWKVYPNDGNDKPQTENSNPFDPNNPNDPNKPSNPEDPNNKDNPENPQDSKTDTYVFGFNLQKYKNSVDPSNKITGAKFKLYDSEKGGNEIPVVSTGEPGEYRVAKAGEIGVEIEAGTAKIFGLEAKTYYLEETVAPDGYNILEERKPVEIKKDTSFQNEGIMNTPVDVINQSGTVLPSTGGMGTTLIYVLGGFLTVGAIVVLITKKRMTREC